MMQINLVNGVTGDPSVYLFFPRTGKGVLCDLGNLAPLAPRQLLKVEVVLVTHAHVDHFIGFDQLLRQRVPHFKPLTVVGPPGMAGHVSGKLKGYLWNLLEPDQLIFDVFEVHGSEIKYFRIDNNHHFEPKPLPLPDGCCPKNILQIEDGVTIEAALLDHGTPVVGYSIRRDCVMRVDEDGIKALGFTPGPWIGALQKAARENDLQQKIIVEGKEILAQDLADKILSVSSQRDFSYVTDIVFSKGNLHTLKNLVQQSETLVCETNFSAADRHQATLKKHLTTKQAALIAASCQVKNLTTFHYSNKYAHSVDEIMKEAQDFFAQFQKLSPGQLQKEVDAEISSS